LIQRCFLEFSYLLIEVFVKIAFNNRSMRFLQLISIQVHKDGLYIIDKFVNPGEVQ